MIGTALMPFFGLPLTDQAQAYLVFQVFPDLRRGSDRGRRGGKHPRRQTEKNHYTDEPNPSGTRQLSSQTRFFRGIQIPHSLNKNDSCSWGEKKSEKPGSDAKFRRQGAGKPGEK